MRKAILKGILLVWIVAILVVASGLLLGACAPALDPRFDTVPTNTIEVSNMGQPGTYDIVMRCEVVSISKK